jgi:hypothetical protein
VKAATSPGLHFDWPVCSLEQLPSIGTLPSSLPTSGSDLHFGMLPAWYWGPSLTSVVVWGWADPSCKWELSQS